MYPTKIVQQTKQLFTQYYIQLYCGGMKSQSIVAEVARGEMQNSQAVFKSKHQWKRSLLGAWQLMKSVTKSRITTVIARCSRGGGFRLNSDGKVPPPEIPGHLVFSLVVIILHLLIRQL